MQLFKSTKKSPLKVVGFKPVGGHSDYGQIYYYVRELEHDNFDLMEAKIEPYKRNKYCLAAGTTIKMIDTFMANYLYMRANKIEYNKETFIEYALNTSFKPSEDELKQLMTIYTNVLDEEHVQLKEIQDILNDGYTVLSIRNGMNFNKYGINTITFVKNHYIESAKREFTLFKTINLRLRPSFIKGESTDKYIVEKVPDTIVLNDLLEGYDNE